MSIEEKQEDDMIEISWDPKGGAIIFTDPKDPRWMAMIAPMSPDSRKENLEPKKLHIVDEDFSDR